MKILKARNGIALVAVLVILLITSLFIPVMFNLSDSSLAIAVKGTDRQRASYFARTVTEMSVAAYQKFDLSKQAELTYVDTDGDGDISDEEEREQYLRYYDADGDGNVSTEEIAQKTGEEAAYNENWGRVRTEIDKLLAGDVDEIEVSPVELYLKTDDNGTIYHKIIGGVWTQISKADYDYLAVCKDELNEDKNENEKIYIDDTKKGKVETLYYATNDGKDPNYDIYEGDPETYKHLGTANCVITYKGGVSYFKKEISTGVTTEIEKKEYDRLREEYLEKISNGSVAGLDYEVSSVNNKNVTFTTEATVNGVKATKSAILILQTYPTEDNWFRFKPESGGNQIFVDPEKATATLQVDYRRSIGESAGSYKPQPLLVYSSVGNMIISSGVVLDEDNKPNKNGLDNSQFVLGVEPGLNTTPNNDPACKILDGANYNTTLDEAQDNNFVAFASTKAIRVELPINLLVNPCRAGRLGDGIGKTNGSLFKIMLFQAQDIIFDGRLDMMMSFYVPSNSPNARRMSSVVLNAPSNTPYSYVHEKYGVVKAGRVFFAEDCYLWVIPYGDDGSSSSWAGVLAETVYKSDSDFQKIKIANAGDVYYFNAEVSKTSDMEKWVDTNKNGKVDDGEYETVKDENGKVVTVTDLVGFSLTGYALDTIYLPNYQQNNRGEWWEVWQNAQTDMFANRAASQNPTYHKDDFRYIGNMNDGISVIEYPAVDDYYVIWNS